ncbi:hypothetical protein K6Y31_14435 [Motilimonas cestriensis]|uniref:Chitin-binding type-3 domain-containing protein n=1 Tax=Motilimonas cestriensis TaxID=2742685 RepID=A0ABS8WD01_9GAMM|nr:carbohydrate-binding protein [Motilimonas cestriensis]MCE2596007.1 hypothetical protein [Motilimonas cestriensis]
MSIKMAMAASVLSLSVSAAFASVPLKENSYDDFHFNGQLTIPYGDFSSTIKYVESLNLGITQAPSSYIPGPWDPQFPNEADSGLSDFEASLTAAYLDNVNSLELARYLSMYHLSIYLKQQGLTVEAVKRNILAQYYLSRVIELSDQKVLWAEKARSIIAEKLHHLIIESGDITTESSPSHDDFINSFNYVESNRYQAIDALFADFIESPNNAMTVAYLTAANIWIGGEANYDDPVILQGFVFSSYFASLSLLMAEDLEQRWEIDPDNNERLRLASILGGWSIPARRWIAKLHGDEQAIATLDEEHDLWLEHNAAFHSLSVGLMFFDEPEHLLEGWQAWFSGFTHCQEVAGLRSCPDRPRISFNQIGFTLGAVDYLIKLGDFDTANMFLAWKYAPFLSYDFWDLGQEAWDYRMSNMNEMSELYSNANPDDDPVNFLSKEHKWGPDTITCQACHQAQSRHWTEQEKDNVLPPHESVASLGNWPEMTTSWLSSSSDASGNCAGAAVWDVEKVYKRGDIVISQAGKYRAKWWTQASDPIKSGAWGDWEFIAFCSSGVY